MLSGNLVRVRVAKQRVIPLYLDRADPQWLEVAESLLLIFREGVGRTRGEIEAEIDEMLGEGLATLAHRGLAKILEDRAEFEVVADVLPEAVREKVFAAAAAQRKALRESGQARTPFRRDAVLEGVAEGLRPPPRPGRRRPVRRPPRREPPAQLRPGDRRPAPDRPVQRRPRAVGPAPVGPGRGRGPPREAGPLPPAFPPAEVPPPAVPGRRVDGAKATSSTSTGP